MHRSLLFLVVFLLPTVLALPCLATELHLDGDPLNIDVFDSGVVSPNVGFYSEFVFQPYDERSEPMAGTSLQFTGDAQLHYSTNGIPLIFSGSVGSPGLLVAEPLSNTLLAADIVENVLRLGDTGILLKQRIQLHTDQSYTNTFSIENTSARDYTNLSLIHGGNIVGFRRRMVAQATLLPNSKLFISSPDQPGFFSMYADSSSPAAAYQITDEYTTETAIFNAQLTNQIGTDELDFYPALQWDREILHAAETWTVVVHSELVSAGITIDHAGSANIVAAGSQTLEYSIFNSQGTEDTFTLNLAVPSPWNATLPAGNTVVIPAYGTRSVSATVVAAPDSGETAGLVFTATSTSDSRITKSCTTQLTSLEATTPVLGLSGATAGAISFQQTPSGGTSSPAVLTITNQGTDTLTIEGIAILGADLAQFELDLGAGASPALTSSFSLEPTQSRTLAVLFSPSSVGDMAAALFFRSNDPDAEEISVNLSGTATAAAAPVLTLSTTTLQFADTTVGQTSAVLELVLSNTGNAELELHSLNLSSNQFALNNADATDCSNLVSVQPGASCTSLLWFAPTTEGNHSASLQIDTNDSQATNTVALQGIALSAVINHPPTAPQLFDPLPGATPGQHLNLIFRWRPATDPDGDTVVYRLQISSTGDFTAPQLDILVNYTPLAFAGFGVFGLCGWCFLRKQGTAKPLATLLLTLSLTALLAACGSGGGSSSGSGSNSANSTSEPELVSSPATNLPAAGTYSWRVVADDGNGGTTASEVRTLSAN